MRHQIAAARADFINKYDGLAPNLLLISPAAWRQLCGELDYRAVLLSDDGQVRKRTAPVMGMQTYISDDAQGFVVGMSLGAGR